MLRPVKIFGSLAWPDKAKVKLQRRANIDNLK